MNNYMEPTKDKIDKISLTKDIAERQQIIAGYMQTGYFDRNEAIKKIVELRQCDAKVASLYAATVLPNSIPLESCSDSIIVEHLKMQIATLLTELAEKESDPNG